MTPELLVRLHLVMAGVWAALLLPTLVWWKQSILWVAAMSLYANFIGHISAYDAARAEQTGTAEGGPMPQVRHGTLTADEVTTVTFDEDWNTVEVINVSGDAEIFFTINGDDPVIGGDDTEILPAALGSVELEVTGGQATVVKLVSAGAPRFSVRGA